MPEARLAIFHDISAGPQGPGAVQLAAIVLGIWIAERARGRFGFLLLNLWRRRSSLVVHRVARDDWGGSVIHRLRSDVRWLL